MDELAQISANRTFLLIRQAHEKYRRLRGGIPYKYVIRRKTDSFETAFFERILQNTTSSNIRNIIKAHLIDLNVGVTCLDPGRQILANLINLHPEWTDEQLAQNHVRYKMSFWDDRPERDASVEEMAKMFAENREYMNRPGTTTPITTSERIFAERWLEITERQTQKNR